MVRTGGVAPVQHYSDHRPRPSVCVQNNFRSHMLRPYPEDNSGDHLGKFLESQVGGA